MRFFHLKCALLALAPAENAGIAAVEFAICSTILLTILAGTIDIGLMLYTDFQLDAAVSAGAQYAVNNAAMVGSSPSTLNSNVSSIVNNINGSSWATSTINVNNSNDGTHCYCPSGSPGNWTWGSTVTCGSSTGGWLVGAGLEYAVTNNWTVKLEYDFLGLGNRTFVIPATAPLLAGDTFTSNNRNVQMIKVGFNYLFNWGAPLGGRY